jgi:hypothetical protein
MLFGHVNQLLSRAAQRCAHEGLPRVIDFVEAKAKKSQGVRREKPIKAKVGLREKPRKAKLRRAQKPRKANESQGW